MAEFVIFVVVMIVLSVIGKPKQQSTKPSGTPSPRVQKLIERIQAQQGTAPGSQQVAAALEQSMQAGRQPRHLGERTSPGQSNQLPAQSAPQYQPAEIWLPTNQPPAHRPPQNNLPAPKQDLDTRVRELMRTGHEVGAIRLLCDERELGILDAQKYARALVAPTGTTPGSPQSDGRRAGRGRVAVRRLGRVRRVDLRPGPRGGRLGQWLGRHPRARRPLRHRRALADRPQPAAPRSHSGQLTVM